MFGYPVVLCGIKQEGERIRRMKRIINADNVFNLAGKTSLAEYAAVLARCSLLIGCDSAGVHIAAAVGTQTVTLYGPTSPSSWAPRGTSHIVIKKNALRTLPAKGLQRHRNKQVPAKPYGRGSYFKHRACIGIFERFENHTRSRLLKF